MAHTLFFRKLVFALQEARREHLKEQNLPEPIPHTAVGWSRRRFMKTNAVAGLAGMVGHSLTFPAMAASPSSAARVAIVGAGISGLNAAYQLKKAGISATVYEARSRAGGRIFSSSIDDGLVIDFGAELINTDHADMLSLLKEFNVGLFNRLKNAARLPYPQDAYLFNGISYSETQLAKDLRPIAAQISDDSRLLFQDWDVNAPLFDQLSVRDYLNRHADKLVDAPYVRALLENAIRTEYGAEPHESSALQLLFILPEVNGRSVELLAYSDEVYTVVGGTAQITNAIAKALPGQIRLNKALLAVNSTGAGFRLKFADKSEETADIVIITTPFPALRNVTLNVSLPELFRRFINEAGLGTNEKVIASFAKRFWHQPEGFSLEAWSDLGFSEVWDATQRQTGRYDGALNFYLGGNQAKLLNKANSFKSLGKQFVAELDVFIPGAIQSASGTLVKSSWGQNRYTSGGYANFRPGQLTTFAEYFWVEAEKHFSQQVNFGNLIFAGEHLSDAYYGFMEGGAQTGRLAAALALEKMATFR